MWESVPPAAVQLKRIALALGIPDSAPRKEKAVHKPVDALREAMASGLPVMEGRPDDPMLDLLDL